MPSVRQPLRHARLLAQRRVERADGLAVHKRLEEPERRGLVAKGHSPDPAARALSVADREGRSLELHLHGVARLLAHPRVRPRACVAPRLPCACRLDERIRPRRDGCRQTRQRQHESKYEFHFRNICGANAFRSRGRCPLPENADMIPHPAVGCKPSRSDFQRHLDSCARFIRTELGIAYFRR